MAVLPFRSMENVSIPCPLQFPPSVEVTVPGCRIYTRSAIESEPNGLPSTDPVRFRLQLRVPVSAQFEPLRGGFQGAAATNPGDNRDSDRDTHNKVRGKGGNAILPHTIPRQGR